MKLHIIAAVANNGVIGADGQIPWQIAADLKHFQALTMGNTVVMGRRTYESIGHALPGRQNLVVSSTLQQMKDCTVVRSLAEALQMADGEIIFIIGGAMLYAEALPFAEQLDLTLVDASPAGDTWFPAVDWTQFEEISREQHDGNPAYQYVTWRRK